jgi:signal transduction histidine kinase
MDRQAYLLATLDMLVLERVDGEFVPRGQLPAWCLDLRSGPLRSSGPLRIERVFPFLEAFLVEAEPAWAAADAPPVRSEFWTELGKDDEEVHLEATALRVGKERLLVVTRNERLFGYAQLLLQRARELRLSHSRLTREIEQKDVLVHAIVHDLANPLHGILGTLSLLAEMPQPELQAQWIQLALDGAMRQRQMIREILEVFSAEAAAVMAAPDEAMGSDLCAVMKNVCAELLPAARRRNVRLELFPCDGGWVPLPVVADEERLFRVVSNLVVNALHHSPDGSSVRTSAHSEDDSVLVVVEDDGPGVPPELVAQLFQKFPRGRERGGTGLGLYFCRITVERWGGGVGYESPEGGGARFWIRLRRAKEIDRGEAAAGR